jgi:hypothetical protein
MKKVTAGVVTGLLLGAVQGVASADPGAQPFDVFLAALARGSQGVINGVLAAYLTRPMTPLWRGALLGAAVGAGLGAVASLQSHAWLRDLPWSAFVGAACGATAAKAGR